MQYAILCYDSEAVVGGWSKEKDDAVMAKSLAAKTALAARGKMGPTLRLMPTTTATTIRAGAHPVVLDGPFAETKEQLLGFYIVECEDLNEAIEISKQFLHGSGALEIRPIKALWQHSPARTLEAVSRD
jgi:hypothetical protein